MECLSKNCQYNKEDKCEVAEKGCYIRSIEHTPSYAEEQLEHAQDKEKTNKTIRDKIESYEKENRCYNEKCARNDKNGECKINGAYICRDIDNKIPTPINHEEKLENIMKYFENASKATDIETWFNIMQEAMNKIIEYGCVGGNKNHPNWEEEYNKLKKENEDLKSALQLADMNIGKRDEKIEELNNKNAILNQDNHHFKKLAESRGEYNEKLDRESEELKEFNSINKEIIRGLNVRLEEKNNSIEKFGESAAEEYLKTEKIVSELRKEKDNYKEKVESQNKKIDELKEQIERLEKSTNEYYYNWVEEQKKNKIIKKENEELTISVKTLANLL